MKRIKNFENTLMLTKIALLLSGIKIYQKPWHNVMETLTRSLYYINFMCLYSVLLGEMYYIVHGLQNGSSIVDLSLISPCFTISIMGTVKIYYLNSYKDLLMDIIDNLRRIHPNIGKDKNDQINNLDGGSGTLIYGVDTEIVKTSMKFLNNVILLLTCISAVVLSLFCLSPIIIMFYDYLTVGEYEIAYPYSVKYFFDAHKTRFWCLVYIQQVFATQVVCVYICGSDTLFYALCAYIEMHFRLLSSNYENLVSYSTEETIENMVKAVRRHQELIFLVKQIEEICSKPMLFNIVTSSLLICLSGFNITGQTNKAVSAALVFLSSEVPKEHKVIHNVAKDVNTIFAYIAFLAMSLSQIFLLCFFGDMLMKSSIEVSDAIYKCPWYKADKATKKNIILVIIRAQKPCKLTAANFADLNLRAFTTILSRSWSYFALLKTVYNYVEYK